jgi:hypothetical protein
MNEKQWLASIDPQPMLAYLSGKAADRKLRLFAAACCRRIRHLFPDDLGCREAVETTEPFAGGPAPDPPRTEFVVSGTACAAAFAAAAIGASTKDQAAGFAGEAAFVASCLIGTGFAIRTETAPGAAEYYDPTELRFQAELLRDIFGNPFRPVAVDRSWLSGNVIALARTIYDDRAFARLPILADALEDAGCGNAELLSHCRGSKPHVRGCRVLDLLLGWE